MFYIIINFRLIKHRILNLENIVIFNVSYQKLFKLHETYY